MSFNITFILQMIFFAIFVGVCFKWIWPPIMKAITDRQNEISKSLEEAKKAAQSVELANSNAQEIIEKAKLEAQEILASAQSRKSQIIDEATEEAKKEKDSILLSAKSEIESEKNRARENLRKEISSIAIAGAEKIIKNNIDKTTNSALVDDMIKNM